MFLGRRGRCFVSTQGLSFNSDCTWLLLISFKANTEVFDPSRDDSLIYMRNIHTPPINTVLILLLVKSYPDSEILMGTSPPPWTTSGSFGDKRRYPHQCPLSMGDATSSWSPLLYSGLFPPTGFSSPLGYLADTSNSTHPNPGSPPSPALPLLQLPPPDSWCLQPSCAPSISPGVVAGSNLS